MHKLNHALIKSSYGDDGPASVKHFKVKKIT